jgi:trk system potassium uptake protein TrkH
MKLFNPLLIIRILSTILLIETLAFLICLPVCYMYDEPAMPFLVSALITFTISTIFALIPGKSEKNKFSNRDGYLIVTLAWFFFLLMGALPFFFSHTAPTFIDAFFESTSGFTTTGSTIIRDVETLPFSILFWRSLTHWIGGIGIILLVIIILPSLKVTGYHLFSLESSLKEKIHPKTNAIALRILFIYLGLTAAEVFLLSLGDMSAFESICYSFGTVATGGFSTKNSGLISYSSYSQYIVMIFMFLAGISQVVYYYFLKRNFKKIKQNEELWLYIIVVVIAGALATSILLAQSSRAPEVAFRHGFFNIISIITTTGFANDNYILWPIPGLMIIFLLFFSGASTGSTTGSIKIGRHLVVIKAIKGAFVKLMHPSAFLNIKYGSKLIPEKTIVSIISFVVLYLFIFLTGSVLVVLSGSDAITASSAVAASLGNIGPGLGAVGPLSHYASLPGITKLILSICMILGRVEIITILSLFTRSFWKL